MQYTRLIGPKGQLVLPQEFRLRYGLRPGSRAVVKERDEGLIIVSEHEAVHEAKRLVEELCSLVPKNKRVSKIDFEALWEEKYAERARHAGLL